MAKAEIKHAGEAPSALTDTRSAKVTDKRGRVLTLAEPEFLSEFRLMDAVGPDTAANTSWMQAFGPLTYITAIDGDPILPPMNKVQAEALITRVGRDGFSAVVNGLKEHFKASDSDLEFAKN